MNDTAAAPPAPVSSTRGSDVKPAITLSRLMPQRGTHAPESTLFRSVQNLQLHATSRHVDVSP